MVTETIELPYLVDPHVHFRTPNQEHKEDFDSGSRAALAGGVVAVLDMPNNSELITNRKLLDRKIELASRMSRADIGFFLGTMGDETQDFKECADSVFGLKIYMNNTTGGFTVTDPEVLEGIFKRWDFPKPILLHAEGDTLKDGLALAAKYDRRVHVCHVSLRKEVELIYRAKDKRGDKVSAEVTPHHLFESLLFSADSFHQMKPPLSDFDDIRTLWDALNDGIIDIVATDHAPHTRVEKLSDTPPSGVTGLETTLPVLLMAERVGKITLDKIIEVTHTNPIRIFGFPEESETFVEVSRNDPYEIRGVNLQTRAQLTPFEGRRVLDKISRVSVRGKVVFENGHILAVPGKGKVLTP